MSTVTSLLTRVRYNLNQTTEPTTSNDFWQDDILKRYIRDTIYNLYPKYFVESMSSAATVTSQYDYTYPTGWFKVYKVELWDSNNEYINRKLNNWHTKSVDGTDSVHLETPIDEGYYLRLFGYKELTVPDGDSTALNLKDRYAHLVVLGATKYALLQLLPGRQLYNKLSAKLQTEAGTTTSIITAAREYEKEFNILFNQLKPFKRAVTMRYGNTLEG